MRGVAGHGLCGLRLHENVPENRAADGRCAPCRRTRVAKAVARRRGKLAAEGRCVTCGDTAVNAGVRNPLCRRHLRASADRTDRYHGTLKGILTDIRYNASVRGDR